MSVKLAKEAGMLAAEKVRQTAEKANRATASFAQTEAGKTIILGGGALLAAGLVYWWLQRRQKEAEKAKAEQEKRKVLSTVGTGSKEGLAVAFANRLYAAMHDVTWLWDGTDEKAMYEVAAESKQKGVPFALIQAAFRKIFNRELMRDIASELNSREQQTFFSKIL